MIIIFTIYLLVSNAICQEVYENFNEFSDFKDNVTTTPPHIDSNTTTLPPPLVVTPSSERIKVKDEAKTKIKAPLHRLQDPFTKLISDRAKEQPIVGKTRSKNDATSWKIDAAYSEPKTAGSREEDSNATDSHEIEVYNKGIKSENNTPFKPSTPLGSFYDLDDFVSPREEPDKHFSPIIKDDFRNVIKFDDDRVSSKHYPRSKEPPKDGLAKFPYKFEKQSPKGFHKWGVQAVSKPTAPVPVAIPAGGLYQVPFALHKERPEGFEREKEFELFHEDAQDHKLTKKRNPWKGMLHLITALLPVGLIVSALSPNVLTIDTTQGSSKLRKRSAEDDERPLPESCRILCQLKVAPRHDKTRGEHCKLHPCAVPAGARRELAAHIRHRRESGTLREQGPSGEKRRRPEQGSNGEKRPIGEKRRTDKQGRTK